MSPLPRSGLTDLAQEKRPSRRDKRLTQAELAEKTGTDQGDIRRIGRGSIFPNEKKKKKKKKKKKTA